MRRTRGTVRRTAEGGGEIVTEESEEGGAAGDENGEVYFDCIPH